MKILIIENTHGDEIHGFTATYGVDMLVANPKAKKAGKRYIESDLNRSFNGKSDTYEEKRAQILIKKMRNYDFVLDIHSTKSGDTDAVISTHNNDLEREMAKYLCVQNYVYFPDMTHSLIHFAKNGLALELGAIDEIERYQAAINNFLFHAFGKNSIRIECSEWKSIGAEKKPAGYISTLKNYENVSKGQIIASNGKENLYAQEDFIPFIWSKDSYEDIFGFKLVKI